MPVLLPPSEAKQPGGRGRPLSARPPHAVLGPARSRVLDALEELLDQDRESVAAALQLPPSVIDSVIATNSVARTSRTKTALQRYAGVVYDGLDFETLAPAEQRVAARELFVFSGLFGVVRGDEPVPDYRVPAKANLPGIGIAGTFWRAVLDDALPALLGRGLVVDLRSSDYAAMWRAGRAVRDRVVVVRALSRLPSGKWGVISYNSKHAKGCLARALVLARASGATMRSAADVATAWQATSGLRAEVVDDGHVEIYTDADTTRAKGGADRPL